MEIEEDISILIENDDFLFDEHVIQDERLFSLEQTTVDITAELVAVDDELESEFFLQRELFLSISMLFSGLVIKITTEENVTVKTQSYHLQIYRTQLWPWISGSRYWKRTEGMMGTAQWLNWKRGWKHLREQLLIMRQGLRLLKLMLQVRNETNCFKTIKHVLEKWIIPKFFIPLQLLKLD